MSVSSRRTAPHIHTPQPMEQSIHINPAFVPLLLASLSSILQSCPPPLQSPPPPAVLQGILYQTPPALPPEPMYYCDPAPSSRASVCYPHPPHASAGSQPGGYSLLIYLDLSLFFFCLSAIPATIAGEIVIGTTTGERAPRSMRSFYESNYSNSSRSYSSTCGDREREKWRSSTP